MDWYELRAGEPHSIENQLHQMFFNDLAYRSLVTARRPQGGAGEQTSAQAPLLAYLLDVGYIASQVTAITRLTDSSKDVVSISRLLSDVKKHSKLITRETFVAGDGHPYDYEACLRKAMAASPEVTSLFGLGGPNLSHAMRSKQRHKIFDRLSNTQNLSGRRRDQEIQGSTFEKLEQWMDAPALKSLKQLRNKSTAHAADVISRGSFLSKGVNLAEIDEAHCALVRVERFITDNILDCGVDRDVVPLPPLDLFGGLLRPYACDQSIETMAQRWEELAKERNSWKMQDGEGV